MTALMKAETGTRRFEFFKELEDMRHDMEKMLGWPGRWLPTVRWTEAGVFRPNIDMFERDNHLVIKAELPGLKKNDVKVTVLNDVLTIEGAKEGEKKIDEANYFARELFYGNFLRRIVLPFELKANEIEAHFDRGILEITIPKEEAFLPKETPVEVKVE